MQQVLSALPPRLRAALRDIPLREWQQLEEIRIHPGQPLRLVFRDEERTLPGAAVLPEETGQILELASRASMHTVLPQLRQGYLTLKGGHRLGVCGSVHMREGSIHMIAPVSSLNLRLARQVRGAGEMLMKQLCAQGAFVSTLILAPPGAGKTTLLRDVVRCLSDGVGCRPHRVGLADERGEVAALFHGVPQLYVGCRTDVIEGCTKAQGLMMLLRGMNPQVLAADEITTAEDIRAMEMALGCGVSLLATAHGLDRRDLERRKLYRELLECGLFQKLVTIHFESGLRQYNVEELR